MTPSLPPLINPEGGLIEAGAASARAQLMDAVADVTRLPGVDLETCAELSRQLSERSFNLVVAGQFKRGKSTVINAILGDALLPTGVVPLTSIVTVIRHGVIPAVRVVGEDGTEKLVSLDELSAYVTERGNPHNIKAVHQVIVDHPSPWLTRGVRLVDTPGIGSVYQHNTDVAQRFLPQADAVLFIASVDQPLGSAELDFLSSIGGHADKIFCLLNKTDYLDAEELHESVGFATDQIRSTLGSSAPLFPVSAKGALQAKLAGDAQALLRSGFPAFEQALAAFMAQEKTATWLRSVSNRVLRLLSEVRFTLQLEAKLLIAPQEQIDQSLTAFRAKRLDVERTEADHQVLLEAQARALLLNDIEPALTSFKDRLKTRISSAVESWYGEVKSLRSRALQEALEARLVTEVRRAYDDWIAREDLQLQAAFESLCARAWSALQESVDELMRYSSTVFGVDFAPIRADAQWSLDSNFYYKFWYEPTSLKILSSSAILALPKALAARFIIQRIQQRAAELMEAQAGRIRHDLDERLKASVREARRQIAHNAASILARIDVAIEGGLATRRNTAAQVQARAQELAVSLDTAAAIERRVLALMP
jgi:GTP-binding protein EngB required for normal cell division